METLALDNTLEQTLSSPQTLPKQDNQSVDSSTNDTATTPTTIFEDSLPNSDDQTQIDEVEPSEKEVPQPTIDSASEESTLAQDPANLKEKDENICESIEKVKLNSKKTDIYIAKLIEELIKERNKLVDLGIIKKDTALENIQKKEVAQQPPSPSSEDQENQDPKHDKEASSKLATSAKSSKVRLSLLTQPQRYQQQQQQLALQQKQQQPSDKPAEEFNVLFEEDSATSAINSKREKEKTSQPSPRFEDILDINRSYVNFGLNLPGQISEEAIEIVNKSNENIVVQIIIECQNKELQDTDEYVFSIRRTHLYDYNDKHLLLMSPYSSAAFKLALKVPNVRLKEMIKGQATFTIQGLNKFTRVPLDANVVIPKLFCPKELYHTQLKCSVIKLAIKNGKKQENKIPIKNNSPIPMTLELDFFKPKATDAVNKNNESLECYCFPTVVSIPANGMGIIGILLKPKAQSVYLGNNSTEGEKKYTSVKKVLLGKCRESSLIYSFILWIESHN